MPGITPDRHTQELRDYSEMPGITPGRHTRDIRDYSQLSEEDSSVDISKLEEEEAARKLAYAPDRAPPVARTEEAYNPFLDPASGLCPEAETTIVNDTL